MKYWSSTLILGPRTKISRLCIRYHQCQKYMISSFSQNRYGLNHRGTEKILFIDYFQSNRNGLNHSCTEKVPFINYFLKDPEMIKGIVAIN